MFTFCWIIFITNQVMTSCWNSFIICKVEKIFCFCLCSINSKKYEPWNLDRLFSYDCNVFLWWIITGWPDSFLWFICSYTSLLGNDLRNVTFFSLWIESSPWYCIWYMVYWIYVCSMLYLGYNINKYHMQLPSWLS